MSAVFARPQCSQHFAGWEARARAAGIRVTSAPGRFGRLEYIARRGAAAVAFTVARGEELRCTFPASADGLVADLVAAGILRAA